MASEHSTEESRLHVGGVFREVFQPWHAIIERGSPPEEVSKPSAFWSVLKRQGQSLADSQYVPDEKQQGYSPADDQKNFIALLLVTVSMLHIVAKKNAESQKQEEG